MQNPVRVLITGCNRGLGKELCAKFLLRSHHVVIAAVRDPSSDSSMKLAHMRRHDTSKLIVLQIDSTSKSDPFTLVRALETEYGILWLDVVIANAGISKYFGEVRITPAEEMFAHYEVNVVAPLLLFQATAPLLDASPGHAKFITISSGAGSISGMENLPIANTAYGSSKTALNFVTRKMHFENPNLIAFSINPGWLKTSLGSHAASIVGMSEAPLDVEDGATGVIQQIDGASRKETSGKFLSYDGNLLRW